jgi:hypothetical protein
MKHIKTYKLFESGISDFNSKIIEGLSYFKKFEIESERKYKELEPDVKDILLELNDVGVSSNTTKYISRNYFQFQIEINSLKTTEQKQICEDSLLRLEDFLSEHGLRFSGIEVVQVISDRRGTETHQFTYYTMSEVKNLKEATGTISLEVIFSKIHENY